MKRLDCWPRERAYSAAFPVVAATYGMLALARQKENQGKTLLAVLPDTGERYLSTEVWT